MNAVKELLPYVKCLKNDIDKTLMRFGTEPPVSWNQLVELVERCQLAAAAIAAAGEYGMEDDARVQAYLDHVRDHTESDGDE